MEVWRAIRDRRSVRSFRPDPIPEEDLRKILDAGRWAPSAGNMQPLEYVVVRERGVKKRLAEAALNQSFVAEAPVAVVVCANVPRTVRRYGERGSELYVIQDTAAATQNIHLMAHALGYATCWVGAFDEGAVAEVVDVPEGVRPLAIVPIGMADESPDAPPRRDLDVMIHEDTYSD